MDNGGGNIDVDGKNENNIYDKITILSMLTITIIKCVEDIKD